MANEPAPARVVTRSIPAPTSVSTEAQAFLGMDLSFGEPAPVLAPDDIDGWRARIKASDEGLRVALSMMGGNDVTTVETIAVGDIPVHIVTPEGVADDPAQPTYFDIHGGGLIVGGGEACQLMAKRSAAMVGVRTWSVDYRMPPDHPYPAALDDCMAAYRALLEISPPEQIVVGGASAGGNLAPALLLRSLDEGLPMPAALVLLTPELDLTESGDSFQTNLGVDNVLTASLGDSIALYAQGHDLTDPYLSPLFGDVTRFPPTFLQAGTRDLFLSNAVRMHRKLRAAGVDAQLHVFEAMPHGGFFGAPEDQDLSGEVRRFVAAHLASP
jgi:monoterpene epsilon-lactone hydrolase